MEKEEALIKNILDKYNFLESKYKIVRKRRITIEITSNYIMEFIKFLKND